MFRGQRFPLAHQTSREGQRADVGAHGGAPYRASPHPLALEWERGQLAVGSG
jgi:hypothetical protein